MKKPVLIIMAAGMGSRYGGQQITYHSILIPVRILMGCQIIIDHLESLLSIIVIRIDNGKRD